MHKIEIRNRYTAAVLFEFQATDEQQASGMAMRAAVEAAAKARINLSWSDLRGTNLRGTSLSGSNLRGTDLRWSDLRGSDLRGCDMSGCDLRGCDLRGSDLRWSDLRGTNLRGCDMSGTDLRGTDLRDAKWRDGIVIQRAPLQIHGLRWPVTILDAHMQIGCELHAMAEWQAFDDARIAAMDGREALRFWRAHKDALLALARSDGRSFEPVAQQAEVA